MQQEIESVSVETYQHYHDEAGDLIAVICATEHTNRDSINQFPIIQYFLKNYNITFIAFTGGHYGNLARLPIQFKSTETADSAFIARTDGFTQKIGNEYFVYLNVDNQPQRIMFTLMHELVHIILHLEDPEISKIFAGHSLFKEYTPEQQALEREAGYVAGMMLLNDDQLSSQIGIGHSFDRICYSHGMSKKALHNRIYGWLAYTMQYNRAFPVLMVYRRGNIAQMQWVVNAWHEHLDAIAR